jgi:predicted MPP superfamily phosphohydrolase
MFLAVILLVWTGMHIYVFWRASSVPVIARHLPRGVLWATACILWMSYISARFVGSSVPGGIARFLEVLGASWIGVLFLLLVALLFVDLVTLFGFWQSRIAPSLRGWALVGGGVLSAIALVQGMRAPVVQNYEVQLAGLPASSDGTVLVLASDFHLGTLLGKDWLSARIDQIHAERPDIIILDGDIVEGDDASELQFLPLLRRLSAPLGVWAVTGNHEFHAGGQERGPGLLEDTGFHVLHDRWAEVKPSLILAGVDDLTARRRHGETGNFIAQALAGRPPGAATVLVSHTPWDVDVAAKAGVELMLASHTHEGQIWPFGYLVRVNHPFLAGRYEVNGMTVIVCRGTGTWGPRMRLWHRGEIVRITLRHDKIGGRQLFSVQRKANHLAPLHAGSWGLQTAR